MTGKIKVGLFDGFFSGQPSGTLGGDNKGYSPKYIEWARNEYLPVTFFTDICLDKVKDAPLGTKRIVWLLEPEGLRDNCYINAYNIRDRFDYILSFHMDYILKFHNGLWYPLGGLWCTPAEGQLKTETLSMITTDKSSTGGHMMRRNVQKYLNSTKFPVDFYGRGSNPVKSKNDALETYLYSIVIESERSPFYFSEKLIDCLMMKTVPIYWGTPNISMFFDPTGIIQFDTVDDLSNILRYLLQNPHDDYKARFKAILKNLKLAEQYTCVEDWLYLNYPWIFHNEVNIERDLRIA